MQRKERLLIPIEKERPQKERPQKESPIMGLRERLNLRLHLQAILRKQCASIATQKGIGSVDCPKYLKDLRDGKGLKESRRLKHGELNLVMGNRKITPVTRIGKTRNIISFHALFKDGYKFSFDNKNGDILVYSNGCFMFKASPYKDIYETVECISHNGNVILNVGSSNELDKSKLWHSRLRHVNKKRIAHLQKDEVLESFDLKLDNVCESCLDKITKSPFTGSCERGEGLLDLVHICHTPRWGLDGIRVRGRDVITIRT
ncbi:retrotransposon protein, putative, ty1-copia subclass [Tanacetum coccineum]